MCLVLFTLAVNNQFLRIVVIICVVTISLSLSSPPPPFHLDNNLALVDTRMRVCLKIKSNKS